MSQMLHGLFITGTNTGVGKTYVTALIAGELQRDGIRTGIYKPLCSGSERTPEGREYWPDVECLSEALGHRHPRDWICPQRFSAALAPPSAARLEGRTIDRELLRRGAERWRGEVDVLLVEGVGGWLCPVDEERTIADLAALLRFPVLIVASLELGVISHTLLSAESVQRRGVKLAGIVLNHVRGDLDADWERAAIAEIQARCAAPILSTVAFGGAFRLPGEGTPHRIEWKVLARPE